MPSIENSEKRRGGGWTSLPSRTASVSVAELSEKNAETPEVAEERRNAGTDETKSDGILEKENHRPLVEEPIARRENAEGLTKTIANALLLSSFPLLLASWAAAAAMPERKVELGFVIAFLEAALVGGLADWFAVTALFRRPFGLPIPHTAIVPRAKDRIADAIGRFAASNFLTREALAPRIAAISPCSAIAEWLAEGNNAGSVGRTVAAAIGPLVRTGGADRAKTLVFGVIGEAVSQLDASPAVVAVIDAVVDGRHHQALYDRLVRAADEFVLANRSMISEKIAGRTAWWMPRTVEGKVAEQVHSALSDLLREMAEPSHPARLALDEWLSGLRIDAIRDPRFRARIDAAKTKALSGNGASDAFADAWKRISERLVQDAANPNGAISGTFEAIAIDLGRALRENPERRARIDEWMREAMLDAIARHSENAGETISGIVRRWNSETLAAKIEQGVGRDLQFIRINGTIVGGAAGLLLHAISVLFAP
jgi:uncharacterized membrane-anchored protein YjiN (DUF445 family)